MSSASTMMWRPSTTLGRFPPEIVQHIFSHLPKSALLQLRLVSVLLGSIATPGAFRTFTLKAHGKSSENFIELAELETFRRHLREFTCDTWIEAFDHRTVAQPCVDISCYQAPRGFLAALYSLRYCKNVESVHVQFTQDLNWIDEGELDLRCEVLLSVFESLAGVEIPQAEISQIRISHGQNYQDGLVWPSLLISQPGPEESKPIFPIKISITNLGSPDDEPLKSSAAFYRVLRSGRLRVLSLNITGEMLPNEAVGTLTRCDSNNRHEFFHRVPSVWFQPRVVQNLRELALTSADWWGWSPRGDLSDIGNGSMLPNLKVITLSRYALCFQSQIDWIASLRLEKLHLVECGVLYRTYNSMEDFESPTPQWWRADNILQPLQTTTLQLRWHTILEQWNESMKGLRDFDMTSRRPTVFAYIDNLGEIFCQEQEDNHVGFSDDDFVLEPGTRDMDQKALDKLRSTIGARNRGEEQQS